MKESDKFFYSNLILTLIILSSIVYVSSVQPSKEEFVEVYWLDYPKKISQQNFTVDFVIKSHYTKIQNFNITLFVDSNQNENKIITLEPKEEIVFGFNITITTKGLHKVKMITSSQTTHETNEIYFWVEKI
jgi:hypothetical protein